MTFLPFRRVDREGEGEGGGFGSRERLTGYCWGSRMCKEQSNRMQLAAEGVTSCLKPLWYFRKPLQRYKAVFIFLLVFFFFFKELICLLLICFESRTQIFIANQLHASRVVSTVIFFCLVIRLCGRFSNSKAHCIWNYPGDRKSGWWDWLTWRQLQHAATSQTPQIHRQGLEPWAPWGKCREHEAAVVCTHIQTLLSNFFMPKTSVHTQRTGNSLAFAKTQTEIAVMLRFPDSLSTPLILACTMFSSGRGKAVSKRKGWQKILYVFSRLVANSCICEVTGRAMSLALGSKKPLKSHQVTEQRCGGSLILSRHDS